MAKLSYSRLSTFLRCRQQYEYKYLQGIRKKVDDKVLRQGSLIHAGMEAALWAVVEGKEYPSLATKPAVRKAFDEWKARPEIAQLWETRADLRDEWQAQEAEAGAIAQRAARNFGVDDNRWEVIEVNGKPGIEVEINVPLEGWDGFVGHVDLVAKDRQTGHSWIIDYKGRKALRAKEDLEIELQLPIYQYLLMQMGVPLNGTAHYQIRRRVPTVPELLKPRGKKAAEQPPKMSRANIATTWDVYQEALLKHGLDPADYLDVKEKLGPFDRFDSSYRGFQEVEAIWHQVVEQTAKVMAQPHLPIYRSLGGPTCSWCDYAELCLGELRGYDMEYLTGEAFSIEEKQQ